MKGTLLYQLCDDEAKPLVVHGETGQQGAVQGVEFTVTGVIPEFRRREYLPGYGLKPVKKRRGGP